MLTDNGDGLKHDAVQETLEKLTIQVPPFESARWRRIGVRFTMGMI